MKFSPSLSIFLCSSLLFLSSRMSLSESVKVIDFEHTKENKNKAMHTKHQHHTYSTVDGISIRKNHIFFVLSIPISIKLINNLVFFHFQPKSVFLYLSVFDFDITAKVKQRTNKKTYKNNGIDSMKITKRKPCNAKRAQTE